MQAMAAHSSDLGGQPATDGAADQSELLVRQRLDQVEIEVHKVIHGVEVGGPRRMDEAGMRRRDDLGVRGQQFDEARIGINRARTVQQQDRMACALAQNFQLDAADKEPVHRADYMRSLMPIATLQPRLIAADNSR
jgi:hypothetical protein